MIKPKYPVPAPVINRKETFWTNPEYSCFETAKDRIPLSAEDIKAAEDRLNRFAPYIARVFPETRKTDGIIESPLKPVPDLQARLAGESKSRVQGRLLLKCDSHLAISGSIKARGGIYEVLKHAETLAFQGGLLDPDDDYKKLDTNAIRQFFSGYSIAVGSTGNLGLSIGIMSARLGFRVFVHMSADARQWKKEMLRKKGVQVIEYDSDYSRAVEEGRHQAEQDPGMHFIDDENSTDLFLGYAVAASRLKHQLDGMNITVDKDHPLFVYLPCGVGGGPGGITFGLKQVFKDNVHCFFAEPTASPCMLLGLMTGLHEKINVRDIGLDNITDADGLAVPSPSGFVGRSLQGMISGVYTVSDARLYRLLRLTADTENIRLEPSALAGVPGAFDLFRTEQGRAYIEQHSLAPVMANAVHIAWATGGSMVPADVMDAYYAKGKS